MTEGLVEPKDERLTRQRGNSGNKGLTPKALYANLETLRDIGQLVEREINGGELFHSPVYARLPF